MTTTRYATAYLLASQEQTFLAYLYDATKVVASATVTNGIGTYRLLVLKTEGRDEDNVAYLQQYQADRLASGLLGIVIDFKSHGQAAEWLVEHAGANQATGNLSDLFPTAPGEATHVVVNPRNGNTWSRDLKGNPFDINGAIRFARVRSGCVVYALSHVSV